MWTYNGAAIELAEAVFIKRLPQHCHEFRETKLLAKETLSNSARFLLVFILIHSNDKHDRSLVQLVLNGLREVPLPVISCECYVFPVNATVCVRGCFFSENSRVYFPFLFTDCLQWISIPMILGYVFIDGAVIRRDRTISLRDQCVFP